MKDSKISSPLHQPEAARNLFVGGGETGALMRAHDWSATPLGDPSTWPQSLRQALSTTLNSQAVSCIYWGPDFRLLYNDAHGAILADRHPWALGRSLSEVWPELLDVLGPQLASVASTGQGFAVENQRVTLSRHGREEETFWYYSFAPIRGEDFSVAGIFATAVENTSHVLFDRRQASRLEERTAALRLYENIVQSDRSPVCAFDRAYRLIAFNQAHSDEFFRIFGHRVALGEVFPDLFPPDQAPVIRSFMARALTGEIYTVVEEFGDPNLAKPYWEVSYYPLRDEAGRIIGAFHHAKDISARLRAEAELEQAREQLRQSQKIEAVGQLTGGVAHDFNNLLTVIRGSVELLRRPNLSEERRARYVAAIAESSERATKLTGQLLAFARRQALKPEVFDPAASLLSLAGMMGTLTGSRVDIDIRTSDEPCWVNADPSQFDTALINMAVNARDAMESEGQLIIEVRPVSVMPAMRGGAPVQAEFIAVRLTDTGVGIAPDSLEKIFEPFFTTKAVGAGTGLGLSQVFGFAKQSGGEVGVRSEPGQGATFTLYLPRVSAPERLGVGERSEPLIDGQGSCVLVVEDNIDVGAFATQALQELGYDTVLAATGQAALAELEKDAERFDVVFSDVIMPGMDGVQLGQEIRRLYKDLPVLLTSGYSHVLAQNGEHGFELLHKPYSIEELSRMLQKTAGWRRFLQSS